MKKISLLFLAIAIYFHGPAQDNYNVSTLMGPSDNSGMGAGGNASQSVTVDLYAGVPHVHIPIADLQTKDMNFPIGLDYVSGRGVKVQDAATPVGLGWQLSAGGSISRVVRGLPDEHSGAYLNGCGPAAVSVVKGLTAPNATTVPDPQPDLFYVTTPFANFHFSFDENGNAVIPNNDGFKIVSNLHGLPAGTLSTFKIIDNQGNQYFFGSTANSQDNVTQYKSITRKTDITTYTPYTFPITWYLDKIVTYNNKDVVTLNYSTGGNYDVLSFWSWTSYLYSYSPGHYTDFETDFHHDTVHYTTPRYIQSIVSSLGQINFTFAFDRQDFASTGRLTSVSVVGYDPYNQTYSRQIKTINFNYSYLGGTTTDPNQKRLCLNSVTATGTTSGTATPLVLNSFDYNTSTNLPPRNSPQIDYWGYYNAGGGAWNVYPDGTNRTPNLAATMANVLTGIHTATGGLIQFTYELNTYYNGGNITAGGLRVSQVTRSAPNVTALSKRYSYNDVNGNSTGKAYGWSDLGANQNFYNILSMVDANYSVTQGQSIPTPGVTFPAWEVQSYSTSPYNFYDLNGNSIGYSSVKETEPDGGYDIQQFTGFNTFQDIYLIDAYNPAGNFWGQSTPYPGEGAAPVLTETVPGVVHSYDFTHRRGLLLDRSDYNAAGTKLREITNTYSLINPTGGLGAYGYSLITWGLGVSTYEYFATYLENYRVTKRVTKEFDQKTPANYSQRTYTYTYAPNRRSISTITTTDSKGATDVQTQYHVEDASIPMLTAGEQTALTNLISGNRVEVLVHQTDSRNGIIHQMHNSFGTHVVSSVNKVFLDAVADYTGSTLIKKHTYTYDGPSANLISSAEQSGKPVSFGYSYQSSLPVSRLVNGTAAEFFYENFESIGNNYGVAHTGNSSFAGSYTTPYTLGSARAYVIQWWSLSGTVWTFHEQPYTGSTVLSGTIDDVRIFPADAQMTTTSYLTQLGVSGQTDSAGRSTIYQYDGLGRLQTIRDNDNNIIKQFDYQFQTYWHGQPVWKNLGTLRCKPCAANAAYSINMQQHEEKDVNPQSPTFNMLRWVDDGVAGTCVITPGWTVQSTSCQQSAGLNTGYKLFMEKDLNPCSPTYNQTQTESVYDITDCPLPPTSCTFSMMSGFSSSTGSITTSNQQSTFNIRFTPTTNPIYNGSYNTIATIVGACKPSITRTVIPSASIGSWTVTVATNGQFSVQYSGSTTITPGTQVVLSGTYAQ